MKGQIRALKYWLFNIEKVFAVMIGTIVVVLLLSVGPDGLNLAELLRMYLPMIGGIFTIAIMMSASAYYIPQSMSMGATRRETFWGMTVVLYVALAEIVLIAFVIDSIMVKEVFGAEYTIMSVVLYLIAAGIGNLMCAISLKIGNKCALIFYIFTVAIVSACSGTIATLLGSGDNMGMEELIEMIGSFWYLALIFDIVATAVCYLSMRRYEVKG